MLLSAIQFTSPSTPGVHNSAVRSKARTMSHGGRTRRQRGCVATTGGEVCGSSCWRGCSRAPTFANQLPLLLKPSYCCLHRHRASGGRLSRSSCGCESVRRTSVGADLRAQGCRTVNKCENASCSGMHAIAAACFRSILQRLNPGSRVRQQALTAERSCNDGCGSWNLS
jgi:hypothetical protein